MRKRTAVLFIFFSLWAFETGRGEEAASFKEVRGVLKDYGCLECHKPPKASKDVDLSTYESLMNYVVPGSPEGSKLIQVLVTKKMPIAGSGPPLMEEDIEFLKEWIQAGAKKE